MGDNAEMCFIELVDYNENMLEAKKSSSAGKRTRRGRRKGGADALAEVEGPVRKEASQEQTSESAEAEAKE